MSAHLSFGDASIVASQVTHAKWRDETDPPTIEVFTAGGASVSLCVSHEDAEKAAAAVGLDKQYEEWAAPIKAAEKAAEDAKKAEEKAEHKEKAHAHK